MFYHRSSPISYLIKCIQTVVQHFNMQNFSSDCKSFENSCVEVHFAFMSLLSSRQTLNMGKVGKGEIDLMYLKSQVSEDAEHMTSSPVDSVNSSLGPVSIVASSGDHESQISILVAALSQAFLFTAISSRMLETGLAEISSLV